MSKDELNQSLVSKDELNQPLVSKDELNQWKTTNLLLFLLRRFVAYMVPRWFMMKMSLTMEGQLLSFTIELIQHDNKSWLQFEIKLWNTFIMENT